MKQLSRLEHSRFEPLVDQPSHYPIRDSSRQKLSELGSIDAGKVLSHINIQHPSASPLHDRATHGLQRLVRTAARPEAKRAVQKLLLVDGLQQHEDGALRHLVLEARYAKRPLPAIALGYVVATYRRGEIAPRFEPLDQFQKVLLQVGRILFCALTVDP